MWVFISSPTPSGPLVLTSVHLLWGVLSIEPLLTRLPSLHSPGARLLFCWHRGVSWYVTAVMLVVGGSEGHPGQGLERKSPSCLSLSCSLRGVPPHFPASSTSLFSLGSWILNPSSPSAAAPLSWGSDAGCGARNSSIWTRLPSQAVPAFRAPGMGDPTLAETPSLLLLNCPPTYLRNLP